MADGDRNAPLEGAQSVRYREALLAAYPTEDDLERLVFDRMNVELFKEVEKGPLNDVAFELLKWTEARGLTAKLMQAAYEGNPGNPGLAELARQNGWSAQPPSTRHEPQPGTQPGWRARIATLLFSTRTRRAVFYTSVGVASIWGLVKGIPRPGDPNFIMIFEEGTPPQPVVDQSVSIGRVSATGPPRDLVARKTNGNGEAFFTLDVGAGAIYVGAIEMSGPSPRSCPVPSFFAEDTTRSIKHNVDRLRCATGITSINLEDQELRLVVDDFPDSVATGVDSGRAGVDSTSIDPVVRPRPNIAARNSRAPLGVPAAPMILDRLSYTLGYDDRRRGPRWMAFTVEEKRNTLRRVQDVFELDPDIPAGLQSRPADYEKNAYDRGHLMRRTDVSIPDVSGDFRGSISTRLPGTTAARRETATGLRVPARDTTVLRRAEHEIFYYSAIVPQADATNRVTWLAVEEFTSDAAQQLRQPIYVIAGPVYGRARLLMGPGRTPVPEKLFRVLLRRTRSGEWRSLAFVVPNDGSIERNAAKFAVPVRDIERQTGLRFFTGLRNAPPDLKSNQSVQRFMAN